LPLNELTGVWVYVGVWGLGFGGAMTMVAVGMWGGELICI